MNLTKLFRFDTHLKYNNHYQLFIALSRSNCSCVSSALLAKSELANSHNKQTRRLSQGQTDHALWIHYLQRVNLASDVFQGLTLMCVLLKISTGTSTYT